MTDNSVPTSESVDTPLSSFHVSTASVRRQREKAAQREIQLLLDKLNGAKSAKAGAAGADEPGGAGVYYALGQEHDPSALIAMLISAGYDSPLLRIIAANPR